MNTVVKLVAEDNCNLEESLGGLEHLRIFENHCLQIVGHLLCHLVGKKDGNIAQVQFAEILIEEGTIRLAGAGVSPPYGNAGTQVIGIIPVPVITPNGS